MVDVCILKITDKVRRDSVEHMIALHDKYTLQIGFLDFFVHRKHYKQFNRIVLRTIAINKVISMLWTKLTRNDNHEGI